MKRKKTNKNLSNNKQDNLDRDMEELAKSGLIKKHVINGGVVYGITDEGDKFVKENLLKNLKFEDLP